MTILNGEPLDPRTRSSTASVSPSAHRGGDPVRPIANPIAQIMAILGIIFAFALPPAGLVLSIIAKRMSKAAGDRSPFATWGIALGIVFTVLTVLLTVLVIAVTAGSIWLGFNFCENGVGDGTFLGIPIQCE